MAIEHKDIVDAQRHEPKGISTAVASTVYIADGAGSGTWQPIPLPSSSGVPYGAIITSSGSGGSSFSQKVWKDLIGSVVAQGSGVGWPSWSLFRGTSVDGYAFGVGEGVNFTFHIPHDYALGTDLFVHAHWSHNGTAISGNMQWNFEYSYAKGHNQEIFSTPKTGSISYNTVDIATTPRYVHRVDEVQLSSATPSASQIDSSLIEPDGIILMHFEAGAIPTITGGAPNEPFLFTVDIHYQADLEGTKNKAPNFYA